MMIIIPFHIQENSSNRPTIRVTSIQDNIPQGKELPPNSYLLTCESIHLELAGLLGIGLIFPMKPQEVKDSTEFEGTS